MKACLCVAVGGAVGSVLRYLIGLININESAVFPYKTLIINIVGSFLIGLIVALTADKTAIDPNIVLMLKVGLCGGFTTFSTFAYESVNLIQSQKTIIAIVYIVSSVLLSVGAVFLSQLAVKLM